MKLNHTSLGCFSYFFHTRESLVLSRAEAHLIGIMVGTQEPMTRTRPTTLNLFLSKTTFTHITECSPHTACTQSPSTKPPMFSPYLENNHSIIHTIRLLQHHFIYLLSNKQVNWVSSFTKVSTQAIQRYHDTDYSRATEYSNTIQCVIFTIPIWHHSRSYDCKALYVFCQQSLSLTLCKSN